MTDTKGPQAEGTSRRAFLTLAVAAPAAATLAGNRAAAATADASGSATDGRMQDTAHTRAYYDSARF